MDRKQFIHKLSKKQIKIEENGAGLITPSINESLISVKRRRSPRKKSRYSQKASSLGKEARENCENQNPNDPLDPSNYQSKKSEFYWKLHDLTLKIKDYVSNFKPAVKKNPIEEIIDQARKREKKIRRQASVKKIHKGVSLALIPRYEELLGGNKRLPTFHQLA